MKRLIISAGLALGLLASTSALATTLADLSADWSNTQNPNAGTYGTWSYNQGNSPLPWVPSMNGWAPSANPGNFLPFWTQVGAPDPATLAASTGDVIVHTTDQYNGVGEGVANTTWTSAVTGVVDISGRVWEAASPANSAHQGRQNNYTLSLYDGGQWTVLASGNLPVVNTTDSSTPIYFSFHDVAINSGDVLNFTSAEISVNQYGYGTYTGIELQVTSVPAPESGSLYMSGVLLLLAPLVVRRPNGLARAAG